MPTATTVAQDSVPADSVMDCSLLAEHFDAETFGKQRQPQPDASPDTLANDTRDLQPNQRRENAVIEPSDAQTFYGAQVNTQIADPYNPNNMMYSQESDPFFGVEGDFDGILMGNFLRDIVNAEYSENQFSNSSTGILPDVLHVGFTGFAGYTPSISHRMPSPTNAAHNVTIDVTNRFSNSHASTETLAVRRAVHAGEQAFRASMWHWDPSMEDSSASEQLHLTLLGYHSTKDHPGWEIDSCLCLSARGRDRLLLMISRTCEPQVQLQVVSCFPSREFLSHLLSDFKARHIQQISPWIHFPTLDLENSCEEFLAALICAGAADSRRSEVRKLGFALQEAARIAIVRRFEEDNRTLRDLRSIQAYLIILNVGLNSASRRKIEIAETYTLSLVTMLRRGGRFRNKWKDRSDANSGDQHQDLEARWKRWVEEESFKRLVYHILFQDVQTSSALFRQPVSSYSEINLALPCTAEMWEAESAEIWWQHQLTRECQLMPQQMTLPGGVQNPGLLSLHRSQIDFQMSLRVIVSNFWLRIWQSIQKRSFLSFEGSHTCLANTNGPYQQLVATGEDLIVRFSGGPDSMHPCVRMMLELGMMHLHVSLEDIQQFAGNEGEEQARKAASRLRTWLMLPESRRALFHAGQIAKAAAQCPPQYARGFHAVLVYHASLIMWAYALLANSQNGIQTVQAARTRGVENKSPMVWLDGEEIPETRRFILLGNGIPCIRNYSASNDNRRGDESNAVPLTDAAEVMLSMAKLLSSWDESDYYCIPIVSYLARLMHSLAKASAAMKLSR